MKLGTQVFVNATKPEPHLIEPVASEIFWKPRSGGLWSSTLNDEGGQWIEWLRGNDYSADDDRWGGKAWLLEPVDASIYVVDTPRALKELADRYPYPAPPSFSQRMYRLLVQWEDVARDYDAVHVPNPWPWRFGYDMAERDGGLDFDASMFFYVMDAECTCWFRWCFEGEPVALDLDMSYRS